MTRENTWENWTNRISKARWQRSPDTKNLNESLWIKPST